MTESNKYRRFADLRAQGVEPFPAKRVDYVYAADLQSKYAELPDGEVTEDVVTVAGRIHAIRNSGMFVDLRDATGRIQVYSDVKGGGPIAEMLALMKVGDFASVEGVVRRTGRGELTVNSTDVKLQSAMIGEMPDKHHGMSDVEAIYRARYIDLVSNQDSKDRFLARSKIVRAIRRTFEGMDYVEVETPMLHPISGGAAARPFTTHYNALDSQFYLRIAPELYLKRLIVGGLAPGVFEINRNFRNEGVSKKHNPEFTMLEAYEAFADFETMKQRIAEICEAACLAVNGSTTATYQGTELSFKAPFQEIEMAELIKNTLGIDFREIPDAAAARAAMAEKGVEVPADATWGECMEVAFDEYGEATLIQPTHVTMYPSEISPLSKPCLDDPRFCERFESFANGWEIANAFSELNDPEKQLAIFEGQVAQDASRGETEREVDYEYVAALDFAMPPTGGLGLGIDRLAMLLTDATHIKEVILFPTLRRRSDN